MKNGNTEMVTDIIHHITEKLKEERLRQGMNMTTLSIIAGVNLNVISHYENGSRIINLPTLMKVAYALNLNMSILFSKDVVNQKKDPVAEQFDNITQGLSKKAINSILEMTKTFLQYI